jgi:hypothetical protein
MPPSAGLCLLALLRRIRSFGYTLKSVILRCLLFWPHLLRRIWPPCSGTDPKDAPKKKGGRARPSFPQASGVCEGYSTIYASRDRGRDPNRSSGPRLPSESGSTRALRLTVGSGAGQSLSAPHSPVSVSSIEIESPSPSSLHPSDRPFPGSSTPSIANLDDIPIPHHIPRLGAPLTLTHSRITSAQFAGARRSRSRSPSPLPRRHRHGDDFPQSATLESDVPSGHSRPPSPFRPPSPLLFPEPHRSLELPVLDSSGGIQIPDVVVSPPSAPETAGTTEADSSPSFPVPSTEGNVFQFPTSSEDHLMPVPSYPGNLGLGQENARHSRDHLAPPPDQPRLAYPSDISLRHIPTLNESGDWSDGKKRSIGLMNSEQVSRYVNKGDL